MKHNKLQKQFAEEDVDARQRVISALFQHADGRKFLHWLLSEGRAIGHQPFAGENALQTSFDCGMMQVGHIVLHAMLDTDPDGFVAVLKEAENERRDRTERLAGAEPQREPDDWE